jgi:hypothetical protein
MYSGLDLKAGVTVKLKNLEAFDYPEDGNQGKEAVGSTGNPRIWSLAYQGQVTPWSIMEYLNRSSSPCFERIHIDTKLKPIYQPVRFFDAFTR